MSQSWLGWGSDRTAVWKHPRFMGGTPTSTPETDLSSGSAAHGLGPGTLMPEMSNSVGRGKGGLWLDGVGSHEGVHDFGHCGWRGWRGMEQGLEQ